MRAVARLAVAGKVEEVAVAVEIEGPSGGSLAGGANLGRGAVRGERGEEQ